MFLYKLYFTLFLCRFYVMVHICNFCPRNVFKYNLFLIFHRSGDNNTVYVLCNGIFESYSCWKLRFWRRRFFGNDLGLNMITVLRLIFKLNWSNPLVHNVIFLFHLFFYSSSTLKWLSDKKLLRFLLSEVLTFAGFFGVTNFSVWLLFNSLLHFEFSMINLTNSVFAIDFTFEELNLIN